MELAGTGLELAYQTALWYHSGKPPVPIRWGFDPGTPEVNSTPKLSCAPIRQWLRRRWWNGLCCDGNWRRPFQEVRAHLGVEIQRQWSDRAIARTTPIMMGCFLGCPGRPRIAETPLDHPANCRMVRQASTHIGRCHYPGAPPPVDCCIAHSFNVGLWHRPLKKPQTNCMPGSSTPLPIPLDRTNSQFCVWSTRDREPAVNFWSST